MPNKKGMIEGVMETIGLSDDNSTAQRSKKSGKKGGRSSSAGRSKTGRKSTSKKSRSN